MSPTEPQRLMQLSMDTAAFTASWSNCDQISTYLARTVSNDRADAFLHANLFSTVLNELLEIAFDHSRPGGTFECAVERRGRADRVVLQIPVDAALTDFYRRSIEMAHQASVADVYLEALLHEDSLPKGFGFLELATDFGASFSMEEMSESMLQIVSEFDLETEPSCE